MEIQWNTQTDALTEDQQTKRAGNAGNRDWNDKGPETRTRTAKDRKQDWKTQGPERTGTGTATVPKSKSPERTGISFWAAARKTETGPEQRPDRPICWTNLSPVSGWDSAPSHRPRPIFAETGLVITLSCKLPKHVQNGWGRSATRCLRDGPGGSCSDRSRSGTDSASGSCFWGATIFFVTFSGFWCQSGHFLVFSNSFKTIPYLFQLWRWEPDLKLILDSRHVIFRNVLPAGLSTRRQWYASVLK